MKRKGFTLIELLAVIVILAVIAIITIPLIGTIIDTAKRGALGASANGIIESAELYYSTKMLENPETKTFTCSKEGCVSGEERLDYKGEVTEGRIILYADGKTSICIEDGKNAALKLANQTEVTTEEGSCNYDSEDYSIDATVSKTKYNELQEELTEGKKVISEAITNKGVETEETSTFQEMASNIDKIETGTSDSTAQSNLYNALQYSGLVTEDMTLEEMYEVLLETYPEPLILYSNGNRYPTITGDWSPSGWNVGSLAPVDPVFNESNVYMSNEAYLVRGLFTVNMIDLTNVNKLHFSIYTTAGSNGVFYGYSNTKTLSDFTNIARTGSATSTYKTYTIDVSNISGSYYIYAYTYGDSGAGYIDKIWCEYS